MRIRLLLAAVCILALPMWFSPSDGDKLTKSTPFAVVALAGHTIGGTWCECGAPGCICEPGEEETGHRSLPVSDQDETSPDQAAPEGPDPDVDFGTGALMLVLALFVWSRLRA